MTSRWEVRHGAGATIGAERARHVMLEFGTDSEMLTAHGISPWLGWSERPQGPASGPLLPFQWGQRDLECVSGPKPALPPRPIGVPVVCEGPAGSAVKKA